MILNITELLRGLELTHEPLIYYGPMKLRSRIILTFETLKCRNLVKKKIETVST